MPIRTIDGVKVEYPSGFVASRKPPVAPSKRGTDTTETAPEEIRDALFDGTVKLVAAVIIGPATEFARRGLRRALASESLAIEVDVSPDEQALLLIEQEGTFQWIFPDRQETSAHRGAVAALRFDISRPSRQIGTSRRSLVGDIFDYVRGKLNVYVFRWAAASTASAVSNFIDGRNKPGLVPMVGSDPEKWSTSEAYKFRTSAEKPARVLLFIHGTFSSTAGSFGNLVNVAEGGYFKALVDRYDAVIGFEHHTLLATPEANADLLIAQLKASEIPPNSCVDIVAYSRGGLVARCFIELQAAQRVEALPTLEIGEVIFVGCTNAGTFLAEPENISDLVNCYTTMYAWAAGFASVAAPVSAPMLVIGRGLLAGIGDFVRALAERAVTAGEVPGLAAMRPDGSLLKRLANAPTMSQAPRYSAIAVDFQPPSLLQGQPRLTALNAIADRLFKGQANDVVVHTRSMTDFGPRQGWLNRRSELVSSTVWHTCYFGDTDVVRTLSSWLGVAAIDAGLLRSETAPASSGTAQMRSDVRSTTRSRSSQPSDTLAARKFDRTPGVIASDGNEMESARVATGAAQPNRFQGRASMPKAPPVNETFQIEVALSRGLLNTETGHIAKQSTIEVLDGQLFEITIASSLNGEIVGGSRISRVSAPLDRERRSFEFDARCPNSGEAKFLIEIWSETGRLFSAELVGIAGGRAEGVATLNLSPENSGYDGIFTLTVVDSEGPRGGSVLDFRLTGLGLNTEGRSSLDGRTYDAFIDEVVQELESAFRSTSSSSSLDDKLRAIGIQLADALLPYEIRNAIWQNRDQIRGLLLIADEHQLPWEVLYIDEPISNSVPGFFLAEKGLTRWFRRAGFPKRRHGRSLLPAAFVKPDYVNPRAQLASLDGEIDNLDQVLGPLSRWKANSRAIVEDLGSQQRIGVLHLCGHGDTASSVGRDGLLVLQDAVDVRSDRYVEDILDSRVVAANVRFSSETAPLVFLNVCRAGRASRSLIGASGYAKAFTAPRSLAGAGVFVAAQWEVDDYAAAAFAGTFYASLASGKSLAYASSEARSAARETSADLTWLAYCVYGDPDTTFARPSG